MTGRTTGRTTGMAGVLLLVTGSLAVAVLTAGAAAAATAQLYVDKTSASCADTNPGTSTAPFCTIAKGVSLLQPGTTLYIGNGTYAETVKPAVSGTSTAPVTVTAWPGRSPTIGTGVSYGAYIASRSYVVLSGLTFSETVNDGVYVSSSSHVTVVGDTVRGAGSPVSGETAPGISLRSTSDSEVRDSTSEHNSSHGIFLTGTSTRNTVSGNQANWNAEGWRRNANGIDVIAPGNTIIRNVTHDNEDTGLNFYTGGNDNLAALNVTYHNGDHGIDDFNVTGGRLIGNTVYRNCTSGINVEGTSGHYVVEDNVAVDNAVYPAYNGISCSRRAGNIGIWDSAPASTTVDHNLVWLTTSGTMYTFGSGYKSLAAMQAATGQEDSGIQGDPRFVAASSGDLRLAAGSPAIDRGDSGVSGAQDHDLLGAARADDPATANTFASGPRLYDDLGAYEFQPSGSPPPPPPPPSAPTARLAVTPTTGTAPLAVTADASASTDPQGQTLTYAFDFGDGTTTGAQAAATARHTYGTAGKYTVKVTVTDTSGLTASTTTTVTATTAAATAPAYVSQIATNYSTGAKTSGSITVWRAAGVQAGDLVVLTLQLTGTAATGPVTASDPAGTSYATAASVSDGGGHRLVVLDGVAPRALAVNDRIDVAFPSSAGGYRLLGDEFAGATALDAASTATGTGSAFSSGTAQAATGNEIAFSAVSVPSTTTAPTWAAGWTSLGSYSIASSYLSRAYRLPVSGAVSGTGTAGGAWLAGLATFRQ